MSLFKDEEQILYNYNSFNVLNTHFKIENFILKHNSNVKSVSIKIPKPYTIELTIKLKWFYKLFYKNKYVSKLKIELEERKDIRSTFTIIII